MNNGYPKKALTNDAMNFNDHIQSLKHIQTTN